MVNSHTQNFLDLLPAYKERQGSVNSWMAKCPAHEDKSASLVITDAPDRVLVNCFAGCTAQDVCSALGVGLSALFPPRSKAIQRAYSEHEKQKKRHERAWQRVHYIKDADAMLIRGETFSAHERQLVVNALGGRAKFADDDELKKIIKRRAKQSVRTLLKTFNPKGKYDREIQSPYNPRHIYPTMHDRINASIMRDWQSLMKRHGPEKVAVWMQEMAEKYPQQQGL